MHERKQLMHQLSDGFVALPGGFGTLEELLETLTWAQLGIHDKPCGLVNVDGYYDPLLALLDGAGTAGLLQAEHRAMLLSADEPAALLRLMRRYRAPLVKRWIGAAEA
jgi:uncharacterized protein (TIGR00730 family)